MRLTPDTSRLLRVAMPEVFEIQESEDNQPQPRHDEIEHGILAHLFFLLNWDKIKSNTDHCESQSQQDTRHQVVNGKRATGDQSNDQYGQRNSAAVVKELRKIVPNIFSHRRYFTHSEDDVKMNVRLREKSKPEPPTEVVSVSFLRDENGAAQTEGYESDVKAEERVQ